MTLTKEQKDAIGIGETVTIEIDGAQYILIRKDVYEKGRVSRCVRRAFLCGEDKRQASTESKM